MKKIDYSKLSDIIGKSELLEKEEVESLIHALSDITESIERVYGEIIPGILTNSKSKEVLQELLWDIREEFRHIEYHINDAKLNSL